MIAVVMRHGGIDPRKIVRAGYNLKEDFIEFGIFAVWKKGGWGLDEMANILIEAGDLAHTYGDRIQSMLVGLQTKGFSLLKNWDDEIEKGAANDYL